MKDIAFYLLLAIAPFLPFCLFNDDNDLDDNKRPLSKHKPSSTICDPGAKKKRHKK